MNNTGKTVWIVVIVLVIIGVIAAVVHSNRAAAPVTNTSTMTSSVSYSCDANKTIAAVYTTGMANLTLSDGRTLSLAQAVSGSGVRYTDAADTIEFRNEGSNAFLTENGATTYDNCVAGTTTPPTTASNGMTTFTDQGNTFSFMYPAGITVAGGGVGYTTDWLVNNQDQTTGLILAKATIAGSTQPKTNFGDATFIVGTSSDPKAVTDCTATPVGNNPQVSSVTINGVTYQKVIDSDAGAGTLYNTTSYSTVRNNQCYVIEYTIHSSELGNYDPSQGVTAFDPSKITVPFEQMVQSFKFL